MEVSAEVCERVLALDNKEMLRLIPAAVRETQGRKRANWGAPHRPAWWGEGDIHIQGEWIPAPPFGSLRGSNARSMRAILAMFYQQGGVDFGKEEQVIEKAIPLAASPSPKHAVRRKQSSKQPRVPLGELSLSATANVPRLPSRRTTQRKVSDAMDVVLKPKVRRGRRLAKPELVDAALSDGASEPRNERRTGKRKMSGDTDGSEVMVQPKSGTGLEQRTSSTNRRTMGATSVMPAPAPATESRNEKRIAKRKAAESENDTRPAKRRARTESGNNKRPGRRHAATDVTDAAMNVMPRADPETGSEQEQRSAKHKAIGTKDTMIPPLGRAEEPRKRNRAVQSKATDATVVVPRIRSRAEPGKKKGSSKRKLANTTSPMPPPQPRLKKRGHPSIQPVASGAQTAITEPASKRSKTNSMMISDAVASARMRLQATIQAIDAECEARRRSMEAMIGGVVVNIQQAYKVQIMKLPKAVLDMHISEFAQLHDGSLENVLMGDITAKVNKAMEAIENGTAVSADPMPPPATFAAQTRREQAAATAVKAARSYTRHTTAVKQGPRSPVVASAMRRSQRTAAKNAIARNRAIIQPTPSRRVRVGESVVFSKNGSPLDLSSASAALPPPPGSAAQVAASVMATIKKLRTESPSELELLLNQLNEGKQYVEQQLQRTQRRPKRG